MFTPFDVSKTPTIVPIKPVIAEKISLLKLRRTRMYVASRTVREIRAVITKYMP